MNTQQSLPRGDARIPDDRDLARGIRCPKCHCRHFSLVKISHAVGYVRRRRECRHCGNRITTSERLVGKR